MKKKKKPTMTTTTALITILRHFVSHRGDGRPRGIRGYNSNNRILCII